jgi:quercetin dioxygenase-like cupin family protein
MNKHIVKPWGYEKIWAHTDKYVGKLIYIKKGSRLSLQYHKVKEETIYVLEGTLTLLVEDKMMDLSPGGTYHIPPGTVHRFVAKIGEVKLMEVSTTELDDIVRLEDDHGRL